MASNPQPEPQPSPPSPRPPFWRNFRYYLHAQSHKLMIAVSLMTLAGVGRLVYLRSGKNKNKTPRKSIVTDADIEMHEKFKKKLEEWAEYLGLNESIYVPPKSYRPPRD